jgi:RimJ/RimL family protein N-acetyltransferase
MTRQNAYGQPIGVDLGSWAPPPFPAPTPLGGRVVTLEPLTWESHGPDLWDSLADAPDALWTYMTFGPFSERMELRATIEGMLGSPDWVPYAFIGSGRALGFASYLRIQPGEGVLEIGSIVFSPEMQRTTAATEAIYLMIAHAFALGYRRCEWKCDSLNEPSRRAADRLGFTYEGTFRQATHYKGRNRDTAWYSIVDVEWPTLDGAFQQWLSPDNFTTDGEQIHSLKEMRETT